MPLEFEYLLREVDSLHGPGMPLDRERGYTIQFFDGLSPDALAAPWDRVQSGPTIRRLAGVAPRWDGWQLRVGWRSGTGPKPNMSCWVVYCFHPGVFEGRDVLGRDRYRDREEWGWRYMVINEQQHSYDIFDNLCEFLEWYAGPSCLPHLPVHRNPSMTAGEVPEAPEVPRPPSLNDREPAP